MVGWFVTAGLVQAGALTVNVLLVPVMPLFEPLPVAVRLKLPGYEPVVENVTLHDANTPFTKASVVPPPADNVPLDGVMLTLKPFALNVVSVLPPASTARTFISKGVPAVCVAMFPSAVFVTTNEFSAPALTVKVELAGPVIVPSLAVIVVVSAFRNVVVRVVVEPPLVKLTAVV